jgi:nitrite reductase/ring-hydroxylating ferredoxin subunit
VDWVKIFSSVGEMEQAVAPKQPRLLIVRGKRICLVREDHQLRAIEDRCSHNGESLSKGSVNFMSEVVCPLHGYRFNLKTGRESSERSKDLVTYPVREDQEGIFIGL